MRFIALSYHRAFFNAIAKCIFCEKNKGCAKSPRGVYFNYKQEIPMRLRDYLWANALTNNEFGRKIRYTGTYISHVMNGVVNPGPKFIEDVEKATCGVVKGHELKCERGWMLKKEESTANQPEQLEFNLRK